MKHKVLKFAPMKTLPQNGLQEIDELIRTANTDEAKIKLLKIKGVKLEDAQRCEFAKLARRLNLPQLALRMLAPRVRPRGRKAVVASDLEKIEYAGSLIKLGAAKEGGLLLKDLDSKKYPQILLFQSFALFCEWEYAKSIPLLTEYLSHPLLKDLYERVLGLANLVAALVHERDERAEAALAQLLKVTDAPKYRLLYGNALIRMAEFSIYKENWSVALECLNDADSIFRDPNILEAFFVKKWRALLCLHRDKSSLPVRSVKKEGAVRDNWETVRDCDFHLATVLKDQGLFLHLFFGTPFPAYQRNLTERFGQGVGIPETYFWELSAKKGKQIDLLTTGDFKPGQALHRFVTILTSDFYRPLRIAEIFGSLYPDEYFNPLSSPHRISELKSRLVQCLEKAGLPLTIREKGGSFRLEGTEPCTLVIKRGEKPKSADDYLLSRLKEVFSEISRFTAHDVSLKLELSIWKAIRLLRVAKERNMLLVFGNGPKRHYRLVENVASLTKGG